MQRKLIRRGYTTFPLPEVFDEYEFGAAAGKYLHINVYQNRISGNIEFCYILNEESDFTTVEPEGEEIKTQTFKRIIEEGQDEDAPECTCIEVEGVMIPLQLFSWT